jgi:hypothetical protein
MGNEENELPVPYPKKTLVNTTNELVIPTKNLSKRKPCMRSLINLWRSYKTQITRKYKKHSRKIKIPQIKNLRRHRNN